MITHCDIVCISTSEWDFLWTRKQHLMVRLAKQGNRILYVEPADCSGSDSLDSHQGCRLAYGSWVRQVAENLWVLRPPFLLPLGRFQWSRTLSDLRLAKGIRNFLAEQEFRPTILWIYRPTTVGLVQHIPHELLIYEVVDDYAEYPTYDEGTRRYIRMCEAQMLKRADLVFVTSSELLRGRAGINPNIFVSPNGVDVELFSRTQDPCLEVPHDIRDLPRPILGFVGGIALWTDLDVVREVAVRKPGWSIVLIGPVDPRVNIERFDGLKNVHFLGRRNPDSLPAYIKGMDVCLNLFKRIPLTRAVNPLKVYEYLAAGKPVVSTPMPEVDKFGELIMIGQDAESFVSAVEQALPLTDDPHQVKRRIEAVAGFSWECIFDEVTKKVVEYHDRVRGR